MAFSLWSLHWEYCIFSTSSIRQINYISYPENDLAHYLLLYYLVIVPQSQTSLPHCIVRYVFGGFIQTSVLIWVVVIPYHFLVVQFSDASTHMWELIFMESSLSFVQFWLPYCFYEWYPFSLCYGFHRLVISHHYPISTWPVCRSIVNYW